mmetsp:Transcript_15434/g.33427  ORF Transcript_15434/g.33427 Transcript_15434/m.33427 type:complete len:349 (-) Transcript_15434:60-1106(-)
MPLLGLLESLDPLIVINSLLFAHTSKHVKNSRHHSLESAEVHVSTSLKLGKDLISILSNLVLDVHLSSTLVHGFTGESIVNSEVIRVACLGILELVIIKEGVAVGDSKEQPSLTLVNIGGRGVLEEKTTYESTEGSNTSSGGNHDVIRVGILLGHEHDLTGGSGHHDLGSGSGIAKEVGADSLLGGIVRLELGAPVVGATDAEGSGLAGQVVTVTGGGDGVKTDGVGLSVLLAVAGGHDAPGLSLDVGEVAVVVDDDVAGFAGGLWADDALLGDDLSGEGGLVFVGVDLDARVVVVGGILEEVLVQVEGSSELGSDLGRECRSGGDGGGEENDLHYILLFIDKFRWDI